MIETRSWLGSMLIFTGLLTACTDIVHWREQVMLQDGTTIEVDRNMLYRAPSGGIDQSRNSRLAIEEVLAPADRANTFKVDWSSAHRIAVHVDFIDGSYWVVGQLTTVCERGFAGQHLWKAFELRGETWTEVAAGIGPKIADPNLLLGAADYAITNSLKNVSLAEKKNLDQRSRAVKRPIDYTHVVRC